MWEAVSPPAFPKVRVLQRHLQTLCGAWVTRHSSIPAAHGQCGLPRGSITRCDPGHQGPPGIRRCGTQYLQHQLLLESKHVPQTQSHGD